MRVLLLTEDSFVGRSIASIIEGAGMRYEDGESPDEAMDMLRRYDFDALILENAATGSNAWGFLNRIRSARIAVPVLALSKASSTEMRVKALLGGADDVMTAPYDGPELIARLQAIVRRSKGWSSPKISCGNVELHLDSRRVYIDQKFVHLTQKEYSVMELMVMRKNSVVTKDAFLTHLYNGRDEPEIKIVDVFICKLRKKLTAAGADEIIVTVWGRGYMVTDKNGRTDRSGLDATSAGSTTSERAVAA